ncbi:2,3-diketo-5-methylthiopentyl-1-phosphate enolase [Macrococcus sp. DPC7161]|nr:2,3-diketo-5-methylthiopentyl-1-phosphate enolase [Macrococcus sp. DPC7161]
MHILKGGYNVSEIIATYHIKKQGDSQTLANKIAIGLTVGSWTDLTLEDQAHLKKYKGSVVEAVEIGENEHRIKIAYPEHNVTKDFSSILTTVFGKLSLDGKVKLLDLELHQDYVKHFKGPAFGIGGIRDVLKVYERPLVMSIFKGIIGRDVAFFKSQLYEQALSVDIIKDDEILYDVPELPFETRIQEGKKILEQVKEETGRNVLYAVNLSGPVFSLKEKAITAQKLGANALLFNVHAYGLDALKGLRELDLGIPILAHPALSGALCGSDDYGLDYGLLLSKLTRLAGADLILFPAPYGSVPLSTEDANRIVQYALEEQPYKKSLPVPSAGIHPGLVAQLIDDFGKDIVINAGGGVHGHPRGTVAGGRAFLEAIEVYYGRSGGQAYEEAVKLWGTS